MYHDLNRLPAVLRDELKPLFTRLSKTNLLQRCLQGITQNQNEAINAVLWKKCPKSVFCGMEKLDTCVAQTVLHWNQGAASSASILSSFGINPGINTTFSSNKQNHKRIHAAAVKVSSKYRKRRRVLRHNRKAKPLDKKNHQSGAFSTGESTEKKKSTAPKEKEIKEDTFIDVTFIDDNYIEVILEIPIVGFLVFQPLI